MAGGHGDVPLIHLPLRCGCGSDRCGIIIEAISTGKWATREGGECGRTTILPSRVLETLPGRPTSGRYA